MRALVCFVLLLASALPAAAAPRIELLTMSPGDDVWSRFGHTAVRVIEPEEPLDVVFSFGYAPFTQPSFIWRFLRGEAKFGVGVREWSETRRHYRAANRTLMRQPLALSPAQAERLSQALALYMLPAHSEYTYDQLRDNCATRVRDLIDDAAGGALRRAAGGPTGRTYRDHTLRASAGQPWLSFTLDFIGGPNQETPLDGWSEMYLPRYLHDTLGAATLDDGRALSPESITVFERKGPAATAGYPASGRYGWLVFALGVAGLCLCATRAGGLRIAAGGALCVFGAATGLWAVLLDALVAVSRVPDFAWNENVLGWWPTDFVLCAIGVRLLRGAAPSHAIRGWLYRYCQLRVAVQAGLILLTLVGVLPQDNVSFSLAPALVFAALGWSGRRSA